MTKVKQRTKTDPLNIHDVEIKIADGLSIFDTLHKTKNHEPIKFQIIKISPNDLKRLHSLIKEYPEYFVQGFELEVIYPALLHMSSAGARGKFKGRETTLFWLKRESASLYHLFSYLIKTGKTPSYLQKLLNEIGGHEQLFNAGKPDPIALTMWCMEGYMAKMKDINNKSMSLDSLGITSFKKAIEESDLHSFYNHYIQEVKYYETLPDRDMSDDELEALAKEPPTPFYYIFKYLELI